MKKILIGFLVLLFSCDTTPSQNIYYLKQAYSQDYNSEFGMEEEDKPFLAWEVKKDSIIIDGTPKKYEKKGSRLLIYGDDLEADYTIKTWSKDEIFLSQRDGRGKETLYLFKK
ncbi:hypothetical protein [Mongoliibacter ruber]|uniref:Uncharacterized protein n=1 Tax=Mongoliibacter ruber TaxID=1750599 RepID=A0A2T0WV44_9BACT|nr:hypothetical protein [Mongoliibacter ruber]PRY90547.1 hypothetical protein CLW00_101209 [Mongoliibacter ruber]